MSDWTQGTADVQNGSDIVTINNGAWTLGDPPNVRRGDDFVRVGDGVTYKLLSVTNIDPVTDEGVLEKPYEGVSGSAVAYAVVQNTQAAPGDTTGNRSGAGAPGPQGPGGTMVVTDTVTLPPGNPADMVEQSGSTPQNRLYEARIPAGFNGATWYGALGAPDVGIGSVGDFYIDTTPGLTTIYGPKPAPDDWGAGVLVTGDQGIPGESGLPTWPAIITGPAQLATNYKYVVDTTAGGFEVEIIGDTSKDQRIGFIDATGFWADNPVTVRDDANNFRGNGTPLILDRSLLTINLQMMEPGKAGAEEGWAVEMLALGGAVGPGVPAGGDPGQIIVRQPGSDYTTAWEDLRPNMRYVGDWAPGTFEPGDVARDAGWLGIANTQTEDRLAPIPEGQPVKIYDDPAPAWTVNTYTGHVYQALEVMVPDDDLIEVVELEVWLEGVTADDHYQVYILDMATGVRTQLALFDGDVLSASGWYRIPILPDYLNQNTSERIYLHSWNSSSASSQSAPWIRAANSNQHGDPGTGNWNTRNNGNNVRINYTDEQSADRQALVTDVGLVGTLLTLTQANNANKWATYEILAIDAQAAHVVYSTNDVATGPQGEPDVGAVTDITFDIPVLTSVSYVTLANHLAQFPGIAGLLSFDAPNGTPTQDGPGINMTVQVYSISDDWDILSTSSIGA